MIIQKNIQLVKFILYFSFFVLSFSSYSQEFNFRHYTTEDGLPSSEVYHVFQDSKGYIWFATDNGVSRYDGYEFKNFLEKDGLPDNTVFEIYEDYKGRIWFIPHSAKFSYYKNDSIFTYKFNNNLQDSLHINPIPNKQSFLVDSTFIYYLDKRNGSFTIDSTGAVSGTDGKHKRSILLDINLKLTYNFFPLESENNIDVKKNNKSIFDIPNKAKLFSLFKPTNSFQAIKRDNKIFISIREYLIQIDNLNKYTYTKAPTEIIWISSDSNKNLWIGTRTGAYCYENLDISTSPKHHLLKDKEISSIYNDKDGGYWFSTLHNGAYYLPDLQISNYKNIFNNKNINSITYDSSELWIGSEGKVISIGHNQSNFKEINIDKNYTGIDKIVSDSLNKKVWIISKKIYSYSNNEKNTYLCYYNDSFISRGAEAKDLIINKNGVWLATSTGLFKYNNESKLFLHKGNLFDKVNSICNTQDEKYIFCGTNNGLWSYSVQEDNFKYYGTNNRLLSNQINCILDNSYQNNYWLGTKSDGIVIYKSDTTVYNITTDDGLSSNSITSLFQNDSVIWVGTINGLNKIELRNKRLAKDFTITSYSKIHGISSQEINDIYADDSIVYLATKNGLNLIRYKEIKINTASPEVYFKTIKIQGKDTIIKNSYSLPHNKNSLYIEYTGLMYRNNLQKIYRYNLERAGKNSGWTETTDNFLRFSYLPPGKYNLKIIAVNEDGIESSHPAELSFKINPPFWSTLWFIALSVIIILSTIYLLYLSRIKELNRRNEIEKKLLKEVNKYRQQALSQQMNPHFIFNTLNSIQFFIYDNDNDSSILYLSKFAKLMRIVLENSQHDTIPIQKEIDALNLYIELESLRFDDGFDYSIQIENNIDTLFYHIYPLLIQPYVENSIWHGLYHKKGEKNLKVELLNRDNYIYCVVEDNGIGRARSYEINKNKIKRHKSLGTKITNKRIEVINKLYHRNFNVEYIDLIENDNPVGTKVILKIPKISN